MLRHHRRSGFTLLELLIASILFALVGAGAFTTFSLIRDAERRTEQRQERRRAMRIALQMLGRELRSCLSSGGVYDTGLVIETEDDGLRLQSVLSFVSQSHDPLRARLGESDLASLSYQIVGGEDSDQSAPGLYRTIDTVFDRVLAIDTALPTDEEPNKVAWELLVPDAIGFLVEPYDGTDWVEVWDPETAEALPRALRVSIEMAPEDEEDAEAIDRGQRLPEVWTTVIYLRQGEELEDLALTPEGVETEEEEAGALGEAASEAAGAAGFGEGGR